MMDVTDPRERDGEASPIVQIAQRLHPEIDFIASGHTHQPYICNIPDPLGRPRMVTSASAFGRVVTESSITIDRRSGDVRRNLVTSTNHLVLRTVAKDPVQTAIIAKWTALAAPRANRVVGTVTTDIRRSASRATESDLANLIADAQLAATSAAGDGGAQIALMNPGGVRADLTFASSPNIPTDQPGQVTFGEAFTVQPFGNLMSTMPMTGAQIKAALVLLVAIDLAVIVTLVLFHKVRPMAAYLLLPYLAWVSFAAFLNFTIWQLN